MKIFFASDIHGSPACLTMALDAFTREKAGVLVLLGDLLYHGPRNPLPGDYDPAKTAAMLNEYREHIVAVRGNCDSEVDQTLLDFPIMADHSTILDGTTRLFLTHGHLFSLDSLPPLPAGSVFVFGHTHVPMAEILKYAPDLRSMTGGQGTFTMEFALYEECPANIQSQIIEAAGNPEH